MSKEPYTINSITDISYQIETLWDDINESIQRVLRSGKFIMGPEVTTFEKEVAAYMGVKHAMGVNSGTDALIIGLRALGIGAGDEVITTPFTFFATAEAICNIGAIPVFVDVERESMNIDPDLIEKAITKNTRAIIPVHLFGRPASMKRIMEIAQKYSLSVLEDCAQSFGARYFVENDLSQYHTQSSKCEFNDMQTGSIGDVGAFSFYPSKNLGALGDGGMLVTDSDEVAELAYMLRNHGSCGNYYHETVGYNSRLDELQAAILRVKLPYVEAWNMHRVKLAKQYNALLNESEIVECPEITQGHTFHQYTIRCKTSEIRENLKDNLCNHGVPVRVYYPFTLSKMLNKDVRIKKQNVAQKLSNTVLSLPINILEISAELQEVIIDSVNNQPYES